MNPDHITILAHLLAAVVAGGLIGLERSYHGRPAGFRTHTLVCTASSLLMLVTVYQMQLLPDLPLDIVRIDPTRMGQGIMTGIGFLGAGVIMKEGLSIRGLTTAASIWMTASIGILLGVGFYFPAAVATVLTLMTLSLFRWIEAVMPTLSYAHLSARFARSDYMREDALASVIHQYDISASNVSYHLTADGKFLEYRMSLRSKQSANFKRLAEGLAGLSQVNEFSLTPAGEK